MMDQFLTPAELAAELRRPLATIRFWRATGTGPRGALIGNRVLYKRADVEAWIESQYANDQYAGDDQTQASA
jgi:hypothetical protein